MQLFLFLSINAPLLRLKWLHRRLAIRETTVAYIVEEVVSQVVRSLYLLSMHAGFAHTLNVLRVVKSSRLPVKIASYLVSIGQLLCLAFLYGQHFLNKTSQWTGCLL